MKRIVLSIVCAFVFSIGFSQTKEELKKQKLAIEKEINYTNELLNKTKENKNKKSKYN